jgi:transposase
MRDEPPPTHTITISTRGYSRQVPVRTIRYTCVECGREEEARHTVGRLPQYCWWCRRLSEREHREQDRDAAAERMRRLRESRRISRATRV